MADVFGIQPDHAGLERVGDPQRAAHLRGPVVAGQSVLYRVGDLDGVAFIAEWRHGEGRTEIFLPGAPCRKTSRLSGDGARGSRGRSPSRDPADDRPSALSRARSAFQ